MTVERRHSTPPFAGELIDSGSQRRPQALQVAYEQAARDEGMRKQLQFATRFVETLAEHFAEHGRVAIDRAAEENPVAYLVLVQKMALPILTAANGPGDADKQLELSWGEPEERECG